MGDLRRAVGLAGHEDAEAVGLDKIVQPSLVGLVEQPGGVHGERLSAAHY
jgi:hypothetical protein